MKSLLAFGLALSLAPLLHAAPDGTVAPATTAVPAAPGTAADLWTQIGAERQQARAAMQKNDASLKTAIPQLQADLNRYIASFPADTHVPEAKFRLAQIHEAAREFNLPGAPTAAAVDRELTGLAANTALTKELRAEASVMGISTAIRSAQADEKVQAAAGKGHSAQWDVVDARIGDYEKNFGSVSVEGESSIGVMLRNEQIMLLQQADDTARLNALLTRLAKDPRPEVAALAKRAQAAAQVMAKLKKAPLDLKFTAVDGSAVDLSKMRGKVVLIDFWATWCGPCVAEMPDVVATYQKYHPQGFEIVGVSLDQSKDALLAFTKDKGMVWPQYFDGKGWGNKVSRRFGINGVPTMWLVGKNGMLVTQNGGDDLAGRVGKLLQTN